MLELMGYPAFRRHLYRLAVLGGLFTAGAVDLDRGRFIEGRRSLALDLLAQAERALSVHSPDGTAAAVLALAIDEFLKLPVQETGDDEGDDARQLRHLDGPDDAEGD